MCYIYAVEKCIIRISMRNLEILYMTDKSGYLTCRQEVVWKSCISQRICLKTVLIAEKRCGCVFKSLEIQDIAVQTRNMSYILCINKCR